ncbi:MAG: hypothetical protein K6G48_01095 [Acholeplasmatales bacterium]|nr:hypothetical protein [Acholeplasmatales bacterium]
MKKIGFFVAATAAILSFSIFGLNTKTVNAADEDQTSEATTLTQEEICELATSSTTNTLNAKSSSSSYTLSAGDSIDGTIYSTGKEAQVEKNKKEYSYGTSLFDYAIKLGSYNLNTTKKYGTNYLEFTLSKPMNLEFYTSVSKDGDSGFTVSEVEYDSDSTYTVLNNYSTAAALVKNTLYRLVYALAAGTYHIGVPGITSYIYGIYSGDAQNTDDLTASNVDNIEVNETVSADSMDCVYNDSNFKLVYFVYTLNNVTDKDSVATTCTRTLTYADGTTYTSTINKSLVNYVTYNGKVIAGYEAQEDTYYIAYSIKIKNCEDYDGLSVTVDFNAEIDGVTTDLSQSSSYTFNYQA